SGHRGRDATVFARGRATDGAWLYALQAAKTSITVFGVWLGHVYHWHLVTAAMQMAMFNTLPAAHPVRQLLAPQSKYLIPFDQALLSLWPDIAPPTSLSSGDELLELANAYAAGRSFFDDDPKPTLERLGLRAADFTARTRWDRYPVVGRLLEVWDLVEAYVGACVEASYRSDAAVAADEDLQRWIATASAPDGGNVRGLPAMNGRAALARVLTSLVYRVTVHGVSRLNSTSNPALTFVANFPHCLQRTDIPHPHEKLGTRRLLSYLPNTATIGEALSFYFTFAFSTPYEPFIPLHGPAAELFFPGGASAPRNRALVELRRGLARFIDGYQPDAPQLFQWPRNIET
ncbi:MAG TPA: lipoxygenase family protein, partial [Capillimicrobium sp.]|nr:lipoxygenase family protein [Capillimicrobium sp.]